MKCNDVRTFLTQISGRSISMQLSPGDLDYLATNGYVTSMQKDAYDRAVADVATLTQRTMDLQREQMEEAAAAASLQRDVGKTHSIMFHFEGRARW